MVGSSLILLDFLTHASTHADNSTYDGYYDGDLVDTDMLPTMLVYRDGELVYNWVRVDWEANRAGIEELLVKSVNIWSSS